MKAILIQNGMHKALNGEEKGPGGLSEVKQEEIDTKALSTIRLCLSNEVLREVVKEIIIKGIFEKLESLYMAKTVTNRLLLKSKLCDLHLTKGKSLKAHLKEFHSIVMDLQNIKVNLYDENLAIYLLCSNILLARLSSHARPFVLVVVVGSVQGIPLHPFQLFVAHHHGTLKHLP